MNEAKELPALFEGATHRIAGVVPVKATRWVKDGDHPLVERYPVERREYKGLLVAGPKEKFGLRFGEWVIETREGQLWVEGSQELPSRFVPIVPIAAPAGEASS